MNTVIFAGAPDETGEYADKNFRIIVPVQKCDLLAGGENFVFGRGSVAVVPPLVKHSVKGECIVVALEKALLPFRAVTVIADDRGGGIAHAAEQARAYYSPSGDRRDGIMEALGGLIAAYVTSFSAYGGLSPVVRSVKDEVEKNLSVTTYSLKDSLKKLPLNYDYVRKLFKAQTGVTPHGYLLQRRMELARELITSGMGNKYSDYSVAQLAEACGFAEPLYFSRVFKKYYGMAPSDYSKKINRR